MDATTQPQHHREHPHPTPKTYIKVALFLAVVTGVEIAISYMDLTLWLTIVLLLGLSVVKFAMVVMYFMHLKFDHPALRKPFIAGLITAGVVYSVVITNLVFHSRTIAGD